MTTSPDSITYSASINEIVGPTEAAPWEATLRPTNPWQGLFGFDTLTDRFEFYDGTEWKHPLWTTGGIISGNLEVDGLFYVNVGTYTLTGVYAATTAPWAKTLTIVAPSDLSTAPTASPRDLTQTTVTDLSVVYKDPKLAQYGTLTMFRNLHTLGSSGTPAASSWGGSRSMFKDTQITRGPPRESVDPSLSADTFPTVINRWTEQTFRNNFGGTAPLTPDSKGRGQTHYTKLTLQGTTGTDGGANYQAHVFHEFEFLATGRSSTRRFSGNRMNILSIAGAAPPEGFVAYTGTRPSTMPGWMTFIGQGIDQRVGLDPYNGDFIRAGASSVERTPLMRRGLDLADMTFGKEAIRWPGGDISGGARTSDDTGRLRVGPLYVRGDATGAVIDAAGYIGQAVNYIFTGAELSGALNIPFGFGAPLFEDEYGGLYRGVLATGGRNLQSLNTLIPPMADGSGGAPATTLTVRMRDEFGATLRFSVTETATTTSIPTNLSFTEEDYFLTNGPWELEFLTGAATGETRAVEGYDAATGTLTTAAFSTIPTATVNLILNSGFGQAFPATPDTIINGWQWTVNGGSGSVLELSGICTLIGDGTNAADLDQEIAVTDTLIYYIFVTHNAEFTLKVGITRGSSEMLNEVIPYTGGGEYITSEASFVADGTAAHIRFEHLQTNPVGLDRVTCSLSTDATVTGVQAALRVPAATIEQTWTPRSVLSLQPTGGATLLGGDLQFDNAATFAANDTTATVLGSVGPAGAGTAVAKWLRVKDESGADLVIPAWSYTAP